MRFWVSTVKLSVSATFAASIVSELLGSAKVVVSKVPLLLLNCTFAPLSESTALLGLPEA